MKTSFSSEDPRIELRNPKWILLALVLAAVVVRMAYVWRLPADHLNWPDEKEFDEIGWRLASTGRYQSIPYRATPTFPVFLAAVYRVAGHNYRAVRLAQSLLAGALVLAVYGICAGLFGRVTGYVAALGVALYPPLIYLAGVLYAEHLYAVLLTAVVFCLVKWWETKRLVWAGIGGVTMGLAALCRPVGMVFVPLAAAYVGWAGSGDGDDGGAKSVERGAGIGDGRPTIQDRVRSRSTRTRRAVVGLAVFVAALCLTIGPWTVRNAVAYHHFLPISTGFGLHLWRGNDSVSQGDADDRFLFPYKELWTRRVKELPTREQRNAAVREARRMDEAMGRITVLGPAESFDEEALNGFYVLKPDSSLPEGTESASGIRKKMDLVELDGVFIRSAEEWMRGHPLRVMRLSARRVVTLYSAFTRTGMQGGDASARNGLIAAISFYPVLVLGLIGVVVAWQEQRASVILPTAIVACTAVYLVTTACTRFRLPVDAFWILLASVAVTSGWGRVRDGVAAVWRLALEKPERPGGAKN